jgi:hypothetical protein
VVTGLADINLQIASRVFRLEEEKRQLTPLTTLVDDAGAAFIIADHQRRLLAVITPNDAPAVAVVINMDTPALVRKIPIIIQGSLLQTSMLNPSEGTTILAFGAFDPDRGGYSLTGVNLLPEDTDPIQRSLRVEDYRFIRREGWWSPGDDKSTFTIFMKAQDGRAITRQGTGSIVDMDIPFPQRFEAETDQTFTLDVSNDDMTVIGRVRERGKGTTGPVGVTRLSIYDKESKEWHDVAFEGGGTSIRSFDSWLALNQAVVKLDLSKSVVERTGNELQSPGSAVRRGLLNPKALEREQIELDSLYQQSPFYFPGAMHLYNIRSRRKLTINTGDGDSEILTVDGTRVYYRVADSLYRAEIGERSLENVVELLRDPQIQLAHWAFLSQ